jgi:hypothetical protein
LAPVAGVPLEQLGETARTAWLSLRDELTTILGEDLVAIWAYGGTTAVGDAPRTGADLDTYVILARQPDEETAQRIEATQDAIARELGVEWDSWYVLATDARRPEPPRHVFHADRRDTSWAINRAQWLAGRYALVHGLEPVEIVASPTWAEVEPELSRELEHIERHAAEGDTDPFEATYAILNGSRILHALETGSVAISKRAAGNWALEHLPDRWHAVLRAATRAYDGHGTTDDVQLLAAEMAPFVAFVRDRLPALAGRPADELPRWSGY